MLSTSKIIFLPSGDNKQQTHTHTYTPLYEPSHRFLFHFLDLFILIDCKGAQGALNTSKPLVTPAELLTHSQAQ